MYTIYDIMLMTCVECPKYEEFYCKNTIKDLENGKGENCKLQEALEKWGDQLIFEVLPEFNDDEAIKFCQLVEDAYYKIKKQKNCGQIIKFNYSSQNDTLIIEYIKDNIYYKVEYYCIPEWLLEEFCNNQDETFCKYKTEFDKYKVDEISCKKSIQVGGNNDKSN